MIQKDKGRERDKKYQHKKIHVEPHHHTDIKSHRRQKHIGSEKRQERKHTHRERGKIEKDKGVSEQNTRKRATTNQNKKSHSYCMFHSLPAI